MSLFEVEGFVRFYALFAIISFTLNEFEKILNSQSQNELVFKIKFIKREVIDWMNLLLDLYPNLELIDLDSFNPDKFDYTSVSLTKVGDFNYSSTLASFQELRSRLVDLKTLLVNKNLSSEFVLEFTDYLNLVIDDSNKLIEIAKERKENI